MAIMMIIPMGIIDGLKKKQKPVSDKTETMNNIWYIAYAIDQVVDGETPGSKLHYQGYGHEISMLDPVEYAGFWADQGEPRIVINHYVITEEQYLKYRSKIGE